MRNIRHIDLLLASGPRDLIPESLALRYGALVEPSTVPRFLETVITPLDVYGETRSARGGVLIANSNLTLSCEPPGLPEVQGTLDSRKFYKEPILSDAR